MIHFNEEASLGGQNYFDFFPQELLEGSPYKIRVIEHEDFIDYEIEFVEMSDEEEEKEEEEYQYEYYNEEEAFDPSPADAGLSSGQMISIVALHGILCNAQVAVKCVTKLFSPPSFQALESRSWTC